MQQIVKPHVLEEVYEIVQECVLMDMLTTEAELLGIVGFATHCYKRTSGAISQNEQTHELSHDKISAMLDSISTAISIFEAIFIKYVQSSCSLDNRILISCQACYHDSWL